MTDAEFGSAETLAVTSVRLVAAEHTEVNRGQLASPGEQEIEENKARDEKGPNFLTKTNAIRVNPLPAHRTKPGSCLHHPLIGWMAIQNQSTADDAPQLCPKSIKSAWVSAERVNQNEAQ